MQTGMKASEYKEDPWNDLEVYARKRFPQAGEVAFTWSGQVRPTLPAIAPGTWFNPQCVQRATPSVLTQSRFIRFPQVFILTVSIRLCVSTDESTCIGTSMKVLVTGNVLFIHGMEQVKKDAPLFL
jgi:hypothetical protein